MADKNDARLELWTDKDRTGKDSATYWAILQQHFADKMAEEMALHAKEKGDFQALALGGFMIYLAKHTRSSAMKLTRAIGEGDYETAMRMCVHDANFSFMMFQKLRAISGLLSPEE
jgi:hypothetical protein